MDELGNATGDQTVEPTFANNDTVLIPVNPIGPEFFMVYNIYLYIMIVLGVVGNFVVLVVFIRHHPASTTDWFIVFITVCDFISSAVNVPVYVTFTNGYWRFYGTTLICRLHMFISQSIVLSSSFLIGGLALDRYIKVCRHSSSFSKAKARTMCLVICIVTTILSAPCFIMYENREGKCTSVTVSTGLFIYYFMVFLIFIFATTVVVFSYCKVTKAVVRSEKRVFGYHMGPDDHCCVIFRTRRQNRVQPETTEMSNNGIFKDTVHVTTETEVASSTGKFPLNGIDHIHAPAQQIRPGNVIQVLPYTSAPVTSSCVQTEMTSKKMALKSLKTSKNNDSQRVSIRTTRISFIVCSAFIVTWIPPWLCFFLVFVPGMTTNIGLLKFMMFGRMTYLINGFTNPIIYTWLNTKFRHHIFEIFCCRKF